MFDLDELDGDLIGLAAVKSRIRDIAALLIIERARARFGLRAGRPSLHMSFAGGRGAVHRRGVRAEPAAGYPDRMSDFFASNPGLSSRVAHHISFADYSTGELAEIAERMLDRDSYIFDDAARAAFTEYLDLRASRVFSPAG